MDILGFLVGLVLLIAPPLSLREQVRRAGEDLNAFISDQLPWQLKRVKSFFVGRLFLLSLLVAGMDWVYWWSATRVMPSLAQDPWAFRLWFLMVWGQAMFAGWNYVTGRIRFRALPAITPVLLAQAATANTQAAALQAQARMSTQRFRSQYALADRLAEPTRDMINLAIGCATRNNNTAAACAQAAQANAAAHNTSIALGNAAQANAALRAVIDIASIAPTEPDLINLRNHATAWVVLAVQAAEQAELQEAQRAWVWFGRTSWSLPHVWVGIIIMSLVLQGIRVHVAALEEDSQLLMALSYVPCAIAFGLFKICAEAVAWLVLKGTVAAEWLTTKVAEVAVAWLPGTTLATARDRLGGGIDLLDEEKLTAAIRKWANMAVIMWLPYAAVAFWTTSRPWVYGFLAMTILATGFSLALIALGEGQKVDDSTKATITWFWKLGKIITVLIFLFGGLTEVDWLMNRVAGITPLVVLTHKWWQYLLFALAATVVLWVASALLKKQQGKWASAWKIPLGVATAFVLGCFMAPVALACGHRSFALDKRIPDAAEQPLKLSTPTSQFRPMDNGQQELVITVFSVAKKYGGVVQFDPATADKLHVPEQVSIRTYSQKEACNIGPCWHHVVVIPGLTGHETGKYRVVMRTRELVVEESSERTF